MVDTPRHRMRLLGASIIVLLAVGAILLLFREEVPAPLPTPNGYDDLLKAGKIVTVNFTGVADLDRDALRSLVTTNAEALRLLRRGLTRRCAVPTDAAIANFASISGDLIALKKLAKVLFAEERLAEMENRPVDAAASCIDSIRLGIEMSRGGLMINPLVGIACEAMGVVPLVKLVPKLRCDQLRPILFQFEQID